MRVGIFYALDADLRSITNLLESDPKRLQNPLGTIHHWNNPKQDIYAIQMGSGCVQTAMTTATLLNRTLLDLAISIGPAGALEPGFETGTILKVDRGVAYQKGDPESLPILKPAIQPEVLMKIPGAALASGEAFVQSSEEAVSLAQLTDCSLVDMNLFGLLHVLERARIPSVHLRIVSDRADEAARTDFLAFVEDYDGALGTLVIELLAEWPADPTAPGSYEGLRNLLGE